MAPQGFDGARVLVFESRRGAELGRLVETFGGHPVHAPALREVPTGSDGVVEAWATALLGGRLDLLVLLTGVGARFLLERAERHHSREDLLGALRRLKVAVRGPKPLAVLRELGVRPWAVAAEPNTWEELLAAIDAQRPEGLAGWRVAVQEYGTPGPDLVAGLEARGAVVDRISLYRWALPEDRAPLEAGVRAVADGTVDVVLWTTGVQVAHALQVAEDLGLAAAFRAGLGRLAVCAIGPSTSAALRAADLPVDIEPSHPRMGYLVRAAAEQCASLLARKRAGAG